MYTGFNHTLKNLVLMTGCVTFLSSSLLYGMDQQKDNPQNHSLSNNSNTSVQNAQDVYQRGKIYEETKQYKEAFNLYTDALKSLQDFRILCNLGSLYARGLGTEQNWEKALEFGKQALAEAEKVSQVSQVTCKELSQLYHNISVAYEEIYKTAEQKDNNSCLIN